MAEGPPACKSWKEGIYQATAVFVLFTLALFLFVFSFGLVFLFLRYCASYSEVMLESLFDMPFRVISAALMGNLSVGVLLTIVYFFMNMMQKRKIKLLQQENNAAELYTEILQKVLFCRNPRQCSVLDKRENVEHISKLLKYVDNYLSGTTEENGGVKRSNGSGNLVIPERSATKSVQQASLDVNAQPECEH